METYMEYMVKRPMRTSDKIWRVFFMILIGLSAIGWFLFMGVQVISYAFFIIGLALVLIYMYFVMPSTDIEFEYLYLDKEITVDKILGKEKRKTMGVYETSKITLMCPKTSHRVMEQSIDKMKMYDFSSGVKSDDHEPYVIFYEGNIMVVLDLPVDFVKMVQIGAPRVVFTN